MKDHRLETCMKEAELAEMKARIHNLEFHEEKLMESMEALTNSQKELAKNIVQLNTTFNTLKWTTGIFVAMMGGIFVFIITEVIKLIH